MSFEEEHFSTTSTLSLPYSSLCFFLQIMGGKVGNYYPVRVQPRQRGRGARYYSWLAAGGASITISVAIRNVIPPPPHQRPPPASPAVKLHDLEIIQHPRGFIQEKCGTPLVVLCFPHSKM